MASDLDGARIRTIVEAVGERLEGAWLLIGGALVALWLEPGRTTEDLDLIGIDGCENPRLALMELAESLGLPVETVNSAADFFVERIPDWRSEIELLHRGARGTVYRPTPTLFLLLKLGRLTDQDLSDCTHLLRRARTDALPIETERVQAALDRLPPTDDAGLRARRATLRARIEGA